jgi:hypothetical protein
MIRKLPATQQNRQNILFYETIPVSVSTVAVQQPNSGAPYQI